MEFIVKSYFPSTFVGCCPTPYSILAFMEHFSIENIRAFADICEIIRYPSRNDLTMEQISMIDKIEPLNLLPTLRIHNSVRLSHVNLKRKMDEYLSFQCASFSRETTKRAKIIQNPLFENSMKHHADFLKQTQESLSKEIECLNEIDQSTKKQANTSMIAVSFLEEPQKRQIAMACYFFDQVSKDCLGVDTFDLGKYKPNYKQYKSSIPYIHASLRTKDEYHNTLDFMDKYAEWNLALRPEWLVFLLESLCLPSSARRCDACNLKCCIDLLLVLEWSKDSNCMVFARSLKVYAEPLQYLPVVCFKCFIKMNRYSMCFKSLQAIHLDKGIFVENAKIVKKSNHCSMNIH